MIDAKLREGFWRLADPKISITSAASMAVGAALAAGDARFSWFWLLVLGLALFCMEVAKNAWGDVYDYDSGTDLAVRPEDRTDFSGGKRVLVDGILTRRQTWAIAFGFAFAGLALGALMVFGREPSLFWLGALGLVLGWSYHGPPLQLAYRGLGELDVVICYGPVIAVSTYVLMTGHYAAAPFWLSLPLGVLIAAFLWVNEFPDYHADLGAGKNNLVARLGKPRAARLLPLIYFAGFGLLAVLPLLTGMPRAIWLGFLALPAAGLAVYWTLRDPASFHRHKPVQPMALLAFVLYSAGVATGLLIGA
ncbi:MAG: prenyltransferase [Halioglobus sp.]|nr:prenyltransferase [Halioglobus sp.]